MQTTAFTSFANLVLAATPLLAVAAAIFAQTVGQA
jgi:hypothetical protein